MCPLLLALLLFPADDPTPPDRPGASGSLDALRREHDRRFFEELLPFVAEHGHGPDREEAHRLLFDLAIRYGWFAEADSAARAYVASPDRGAATPLGQLVSAMADAEAGRIRAAIVLYRELMAGLDGEAQVRLAADLADTIADLALASADAESAREVYTCFLDRFGAVPGVPEKVEAEFSRIALLGSPAPAIEARDVSGQPISLGPSPRGHRLVFFWATFSEPCLAELPALADALDSYGDRGLEVIGVALDASIEDLDRVVDREPLPWRLVHNGTSGADWSGPLRVTSVPDTFLIAPDGTILRMGLRGSSLSRALAEVLGPNSSE
ncbi:peroxiredoxin family protein [Tautonia sociabilis]|uniref:Redoxin domain-containing protein n=1 Tax=Tautonia sociabilis TaxID=2080755 RepID=A0A432MMJ1_9BACT|nr:redoxin domain-containing protein [Tautonia sociabilis]RUL88459.1 redoxin domain-containing protein [Tautonia sociabilis]